MHNQERDLIYGRTTGYVHTDGLAHYNVSRVRHAAYIHYGPAGYRWHCREHNARICARLRMEQHLQHCSSEGIGYLHQQHAHYRRMYRIHLPWSPVLLPPWYDPLRVIPQGKE